MKRLEFDPASIESAWTNFAHSVGSAVPIRSQQQYAHTVRLLNAQRELEPFRVVRW